MDNLVVKDDCNDIVVIKKNEIKSKNELQIKDKNELLQYKKREIVVCGEKTKVDAQSLMRNIKRITEHIGEYKYQDNLYSKIICGALRKARGDLVSILENEYNISWQVDNDGKSNFFM